ncbi:MAG: tRNA (adenine(22)-N(1))-methyltransferase TrmK [Pyrinomonadaceae bacterium]
MDYVIEKYGDISVYWKPSLDGGGRSFGQHFVPVVRNLVGRVHRIFDFGAGAGFIGFSLLANGLCETLCLSDVNPDAVEAAAKTVKENGLGDRVTVYLSDGLEGIPEHERWDLVVGNPPHFGGAEGAERRADIIQFDPGWHIHEALYGKVSRFLRPHGSVMLLENYSGSDESVFAPFLQRGGLELIKSFMYCERELNPHYFMWSRQAYAGIAGREVQTSEIKVCVSELKGKSAARKVERFEKVRFEIVNDVRQEAKIGFQTKPHALDLTIVVRPGATKITGIFLVPPGALYVLDLTGTSHGVCTWC